MRRGDAAVVIDDVPRLLEPFRIPDGDVVLDEVRADHAHALDRARRLAVVRVLALILAVRDTDRVYDERIPVPEADRVAGPERLGLVLRHVAAAIGIDAPRLALLLVDQPRLLRRHDELAQERLREPARVPGGQTIAELIPFVAAGDVAELLPVGRLVLRRELGRRMPVGEPARLRRIELETAAGARPHPGPVGHLGVVRARVVRAAVRLALRLEIDGVGVAELRGDGGIRRRLREAGRALDRGADFERGRRRAGTVLRDGRERAGRCQRDRARETRRGELRPSGAVARNGLFG